MNKKELERTILILEKHADRQLVIGFCRNELKLVRVRMQVDKSLQIGDFLSFVTESIENSLCYPVISSIRYQESSQNDGIIFRNGFMEIETDISFSSNAAHQSHFFKAGFSNLYGYVYMGTNHDGLRSNVIYKTVIGVFQCQHEDEPVFRVISDVVEDTDFVNPHQFLEQMLRYENSASARQISLKNLNSSTRNFTQNRSRNSNNNKNRYGNFGGGNRKNPYYTGSNPEYEYLNKEARSSYRKMLVTEKFETERNGCWGTVFSELGDASLETLCDSGGEVTLNVGDWFMGSLQYHKHSKRYGVDKIERKVEDAPEIRVDDQGNIHAAFELDLRNIKPRSEQYITIPLQYLVKINLLGKDYDLIGKRIDAEFLKLKKPVDDVYWEFVRMLDEVPDDMPYYEWKQGRACEQEQVDGLYVPPDFDDCDDGNFSDADYSEKEKPVKTFPTACKPNTNEHKSRDFVDSNVNKSVHDYRQDSDGYDFQPYNSNGRTRSQYEEDRYSYPNMPSSSNYPNDYNYQGFSRRSQADSHSNFEYDYHKPKPSSLTTEYKNKEENGVVVVQLDRVSFIVYSFQRGVPVLLSNNKFVHLGDFITFESSRLDREIDFCSFEVTKFIKVVDPSKSEINPVFVRDNIAEILVGVDLRQMIPYFFPFGYTIFKSEELGNVFVGEDVAHASDENWSLRQLKVSFSGQPSARNIQCRCRFVLGDVPLSSVDGSDRHDIVVRAWHWKLVTVVGTTAAVEGMKNEQMRRNIPASWQNVEEEDEIARTKRLNKERASGFEAEPKSYKNVSRPSSIHPDQSGYVAENVSQFQGNSNSQPESNNGDRSSVRYGSSSFAHDNSHDELETLRRENREMKNHLRKMTTVYQKMMENKKVRSTIKVEELEKSEELALLMAVYTTKKLDRSSPSSSIGSKSFRN